MIAYWIPSVQPSLEADPPQLAGLAYAGPWVCTRHPQGGTLATWNHWPEPGTMAPRTPDAYGPPVEIEDGLFYLPPKVLPDIYDLVKDGPGGVDVSLACGKTITVPHALVAARQFSLSGRADVGYVTEYGQLAWELMNEAMQPDAAGNPSGVSYSDPRLARLLALAVGQRYRSTPHLVDQMMIIAADDVEPLLGAIWSGDPKVERPGDVAGPSPSPSSDCPTSP